jgi:hypothetical protein
MLLAMCLLAALPSVAAGQTQTPASTTAPIRHHRFEFSRQAQQDSQGFYLQPAGLCDDYPRESRNPVKVKHDLDVMRAVGARFLRFGIAWESVETAPDKYDWAFWDMLVKMAHEAHVTLLPYVCYTPEWIAKRPDQFWTQPPSDLSRFAEFMKVIAHRYRADIHSWELWNEPDNAQFWKGSVQEFATMIIAGVAAVRSANPGATVVLGGIAYGPGKFYQQLREEFDINRYVDVVNFHEYWETWADGPMENTGWEIGEMAKRVAGSAYTPDLWLAEFGYSNWRFSDQYASEGSARAYFAYEHTPEYQAIMLFKAHVSALAAGKLSLTAWYRINDLQPAQGVIGDANNRYLGLVTVNGAPKPALVAAKFYHELFDRPIRCVDASFGVQATAETQTVIHLFEAKKGDLIITAWLRSPRPGELKDSTGMDIDTRREGVDLTLPKGAWKLIQFYDVTGKLLNAMPVPDEPVPVHLDLKGGEITIVRVRK